MGTVERVRVGCSVYQECISCCVWIVSIVEAPSASQSKINEGRESKKDRLGILSWQTSGAILMEFLFLLGSVIYASLSSIFHSILLFPEFLSTYFRNNHGGEAEDEELILYEGKVWHSREKPVRHAFSYAVRYAFIDLDRLPNSLANAIQRHHMGAHEARLIARTDGPVFLLTVPSSVGYEQNPLSVYYCYDSEGPDGLQLKKCIAEVTNTPWGERVTFVFNPGSDLVAKPLHVSPFMDMLGNWSLHADTPGENLSLKILVHHPTFGNYFKATLNAKRVASSVIWSRNPAMFFWLMPQKVSIWIYFQAFKLWLKGVSFIQHPRYSNNNYREEALSRDKRLTNCPMSMIHGKEAGSFSAEACQSCQTDTGDRWCTWRNAQWPWS